MHSSYLGTVDSDAPGHVESRCEYSYTVIDSQAARLPGSLLGQLSNQLGTIFNSLFRPTMAKVGVLPTNLPRICSVSRTNWVSRLSYGVMLTFCT